MHAHVGTNVISVHRVRRLTSRTCVGGFQDAIYHVNRLSRSKLGGANLQVVAKVAIAHEK